MRQPKLTRRVSLIAGLGAIALPPPARAAFPDRPLRWIVAYAPGGTTDVLARLLGNALAARLGQPVVVENRPGAATNIGAEIAARSPPDGHTLFTADNGTLVFNPALFQHLPYDAERDFRPLSLIARFEMVLVVRADSPFRDAAQYLEAARQAPDRIDYGSPGIGSPHHLAMELLQAEAGVRLTHVVYRGGAPALNDLLAGNVASLMMVLPTAMEMLRAGRVRALAVGSQRRLAALQEVPTLQELGLKGYNAATWQGVVVPAAVPDPIAEELTQALIATVRQDETQARILEMGAEPMSGGPDEFRAVLGADRAVWIPLIRARGITLDK